MKAHFTHIAGVAGKHRLAACSPQELTNDQMITRAYLRFYQIVVGKLPNTKGYRPVLPILKKSADKMSI